MPLDAVKLSPSISGHNGDNGERSIAIPKSVGVADSSPLSAGAPPCNDCNERGFWAIVLPIKLIPQSRSSKFPTCNVAI